MLRKILQFLLISAFSYGFSPLFFFTTTDEQCNIVTYICCCSNFDEGDGLVSDIHKVCLELTQWVIHTRFVWNWHELLLWSFLCKLIDTLSNFASFPSPGFCAFGFLLHLTDSVNICLAAVLLSIQLQLLLRKFSVGGGVSAGRTGVWTWKPPSWFWPCGGQSTKVILFFWVVNNQLELQRFFSVHQITKAVTLTR